MSAAVRSDHVGVRSPQRKGRGHNCCHAALIQRIQQRCGDGIPEGEILDIVLACLDDLAGSPVAAIPELAERLAVQRVLLRLQHDPPSADPR